MTMQPADSLFRELTPGITWRRSSLCEVNGSCVEVAQLPNGEVGVRDGKIGASSPVLGFDRRQWRAFVSGVAAGHFDIG